MDDREGKGLILRNRLEQDLVIYFVTILQTKFCNKFLIIKKKNILKMQQKKKFLKGNF